MSQFILIAGPQAAGKSTLIASLNEQHRNTAPFFLKGGLSALFPLQENRQIVTHKYMLLGAIFMTREQEFEVVENDLRRMDVLLGFPRSNVIYVDECNIFTIAHSIAHGITEVEACWGEYLGRLKKLDAKVIFLDIPPEVSWERRRKKYEQRLVHFPEKNRRAIMRRYHEYLEKLHPLLKDVYHRIPFRKEMVDGCLSKREVVQEVSRILGDFSASSRKRSAFQ